MTPSTHLAVLALALVADRAFGDPPWLWQRVPHPVVLLGKAVGGLDSWLNRSDHTPGGRRRNGVLALILIVAGAALAGLALHAIFAVLPLGFVLEMLIVAVLLAQKSLVDHVAAVEQAFRREGLAGTRSAVARIVGRDVTVLDESGVARAAIESAAENFSDGIVAPAFWYLALGLPGLLVFKAVNTADSMIGHRTPRHAAFGWASARFDDLVNLIPARLSALLIAAGATLTRRDGARALEVAVRDAGRHLSPNAGWPEAALAGALGIALGGPRRYGEAIVDGAWLNPGGRKAAFPADIPSALRVIDAAWGVMLGLTALAALLIAIVR